MIETTVNCDSCGAHLNAPTPYDADYYLTLRQDEAPHEPGHPVIDIYIHPILDSDKHFCGFKCLESWIKKKTNPQESS